MTHVFPIPKMISEAARTFFATAGPVPFRYTTAEVITQFRKDTRAAAAAGTEWAMQNYVGSSEVREIDGVRVQAVVPKGRRGSDQPPLLFYLFGGGFVLGSPPEDLPILAGLSFRLGFPCVTPFYRLAPEHPFPCALDDVTAVYRAILDDHDPGRIVVAGESAGGNLALALLLKCRSLGLPMPAGGALLSPWSDLSPDGNTTNMALGFDPTLDYERYLRCAARAYAADAPITDPFVSPIYGSYDSGFPPILITTGTRDLFLSDCARLSTRLRQAGTEVQLHLWEGMWHVFEFYPDIPESHASLDQIARFLARCLASSPGTDPCSPHMD